MPHWATDIRPLSQSNMPIKGYVLLDYTQSQKICTMNSLASPVTQGQGQVTPSMGKMKYTAKFIYLHSSEKEMQLFTVRFFRDWVYIQELQGIDYVEAPFTIWHDMM